jgi:ligand-binding sensor domain-containing protein
MTRVTDDHMPELAASPTSSHVVYGAGYSNDAHQLAFFTSENDGSSWTYKALGTQGQSGSVEALALGQDENNLFVGGFSRTMGAGRATGKPSPPYTDRAFIVASSDGGHSWGAITGNLQAAIVRALAVDPKAPARLLAGTDIGLFKRESSGGPWTKVLDADIRSLLFVPGRPQTVYAGGTTGLYLSENGGKTWEDSSQGMTSKYVTRIISDAKGTWIYVGTYGGAVLKIRL